MQPESSPHYSKQPEKSPHNNRDPAQPQINISINKEKKKEDTVAEKPAVLGNNEVVQQAVYSKKLFSVMRAIKGPGEQTQGHCLLIPETTM